MASVGRPPGRSSVDVGSNPMIVLSRPTGHGPLSSTAAMRPLSPSMTWAALVGLIVPEGLAEGAATGPPNCANSFWASRCSGTRRAMVGRSALTRGAMVELV